MNSEVVIELWSRLILSCSEPSTAVINGSSIEPNKEEVLLEIAIYRELKLDYHVNNLCKKACQKLHAPVRITSFMDIYKKKIIMKALIECNFGHIVGV